jgi:hypothetical protein
MKSYINLLIVVASVMPTTAAAQIIDRIGVKYGVTVSDLDWTFSESSIFQADFAPEKTIGFFSAVSVDFLAHKYWEISSSLGFYQKGGEWHSDPFVNKWHLDYLTVDTQIKAKYPIQRLSPYISAGPRLDYLVRHSSEFDEYHSASWGYMNALNAFNTGLRYGFGFDYRLKNVALNLGFSNNVSFNAVIENDLKSGDIQNPTCVRDKTMIFHLGAFCHLGVK